MRNTQKTVNIGIVEINILWRPEEMLFNAYIKVHPGTVIAKKPVKVPFKK